MNDIKTIDPQEFRETGFLQEVNRQFMHPLGLAFSVIVDNETGQETLGPIWDYRDDPEGIRYGDDVDSSKAANVRALWVSKEESRLNRWGWMIQPVSGV